VFLANQIKPDGKVKNGLLLNLQSGNKFIIETKKYEIITNCREKQGEIIKIALNEVIPDIPINKKSCCCGVYTAERAVENYFWNYVMTNANELIKNEK